MATWTRQAGAESTVDVEGEGIEITSPMIEAGVAEFLTYRGQLSDSPEEAVTEIFKAMVLASRLPS
jgi:hypothetical protein